MESEVNTSGFVIRESGGDASAHPAEDNVDGEGDSGVDGLRLQNAALPCHADVDGYASAGTGAGSKDDGAEDAGVRIVGIVDTEADDREGRTHGAGEGRDGELELK